MKKILLLLLGFTLTFSFAQDKKALKLFDQYAKAVGGKEKMAKVKSMLVKSTSKQMGQEVKSETYVSRKGDSYLKMNMMGMELVVYAVKDGKGFVMNQQMGYDDLDEEKVKSMVEKSKNMFNEAENYEKKDLKYLGSKEKDGVKYEVAEYKDEKGRLLDYYFNPNTHLLDIIVVNMPDGKTVETYFKDYKDVDGIKMPFTTEIKMDGQLMREVHTDKVVFNPSEEQIDMKAFEKPE